jgi:hypothetical protein
MRTQSSDTRPETEKVQIELFRKASSAQKFAIVEQWSQFIIQATKQSIRRDHPEANEEEVALILLARLHGQDLADKVRAHLLRRR